MELDKQISEAMKFSIAALARREHSVKEIRDKLARKNVSEEVIDVIVSDLIERHYVDDERFAEMLIRTKYNKGQGPVRVRLALREHDIESNLVRRCFDGFDGDWYELSKRVRFKKFGEWSGGDYKQKIKQMRFLVSRGFEQDQVDYAFEKSADE